ncbi:hypothetical protein F5I97DRAFT_1827661 [Phlebopus sp. FC_14]|nr:hypothetical protein F5I97DRAFT_1827661 [Phlebopus sp. FC_14]
MFRVPHPLYPLAPLDVPFAGGTYDHSTVPLSPVLQGAVVGLEGTISPPPSPNSTSRYTQIPAMESEMQSITDSTPCPPSPYVVHEPDNALQWTYGATFEYQTPQWVETAPGVLIPRAMFTDPYGTGGVTNASHAPFNAAGPSQGQQHAHASQSTIFQGQNNGPQSTERVDPVFAMISRSQHDHGEYYVSSQSYEDQGNDIATRIVSTGIREVDEATNEYYNIKPHDNLLRQYRSCVAYHYPAEVLETLQKNFKRDWHRVMPLPIPAVILRTFDCVWVDDLKAGHDGWAYVVPTEDTIWGTVLERGVDRYYRPVAKDHATSKPVPVQTKASVFGAAVYPPQDIVASTFAVNLFREVPQHPETGGNLQLPMTEYLGAYILKYADNLCMPQAAWKQLSQESRDMVAHQAPHLFEGFPPYVHAPDLPVVYFCYYRWDSNIVGLADQIHEDYKYCRAVASLQSGDGGDEDHDEDLFSDAEDEISSDDDSSLLDMYSTPTLNDALRML